ncbi:hypothetical protein COV93_08780 [Candidatus Woesearchaeota archaeon CG11_big_fil_rev_8_21_14_0_20_43_8]|nr:MAG: hypothetical protein COV93_08780 [Candidatus Woesearchaeota archaeon CG11_big_fil_rev_8_21_14_0_20_43_8]PIO05008.1 MAG: hypothetical protein COT47_06605 [Candidatus Woesearchaeota archaeon CG08_land_8_20_14_0_20_43_7]
MLDIRIHWWYFLPGALLFLPVILKKMFFLDHMILSLLITFISGFLLYLIYSLINFTVNHFVPRKSIMFLDYALRKELRRRDFIPRQTAKVFAFFMEKRDSWELSRVKRTTMFLDLLGTTILAVGFGIVLIVILDVRSLMQYYILAAVFLAINFSTIWSHLESLETLLIKTLKEDIVKEIKKNKLL